MPADLTEFSEAATAMNKHDIDVQRIVDFKKIYTKVEIKLKDIIITADNQEYKVAKLYDYSNYGTIANHYKAVIVLKEV